ncbi:AzlC family ABC transporter permease [Solwaraspora sp. WMMD791]|uniref:AzlC family ABC transporter permease n=1 Tax=Solwaraspora sp. WMMD791 TaxID=3016086 RepID=UPI00249C6403|nr:AzlC family ABC transporter permease [Solwaraspora sp. WMMD791]WFE29541.1 AzlC family ABC transporter permease [Solwaraspora sp. WMMD791]
MKPEHRTVAGPTRLRDVAAVAVAIAAVGASFGAIATAAGLPGWLTVAMSVLVFAGGSQFMAIGLLAAGAPVAAVAAGLLLNARHLPFGLAVAPVVGDRWWQRLVGSHLLTDEAVAFTLAEPDPARRHRSFWLTAPAIFVCWNVGTALGVGLGTTVADPAALGLDAAFPAGLLALLLPALREPTVRRCALTGAGVAVLATPVLPAGLPVLLALVGLATLALPGSRRRPAVPDGSRR